MVDKNLFLYDLAVVAILKNEGAYLKEWLDYHLLAGVEHFYLYDNDSTDNQAEVAAPYVEAGLVDYIPAPGKAMQMPVYNDAVKRFKFRCRYMAFIDLDEFIFPKSNRSVLEVVDEILSGNQNAAALGINWQCFGSNGQEKADYSRGVLERFTRRAPSDWFSNDGKDKIIGNPYIKSVADPRKIEYLSSPHCVVLFEGFKTINSNGKVTAILYAGNYPVCSDKIVINHYVIKSREEYVEKKAARGFACSDENPYNKKYFELHDRNEVFDNGILKYRASRAENFVLKDKTERVIETLTEILSRYADGEVFNLETALTCRALSTYLGLKIYEEASLAAILKSLNEISPADARLLILDLPNLLRLPYPAVREICRVAEQIIAQLMYKAKMETDWRDFFELSYIQDLLKE